MRKSLKLEGFKRELASAIRNAPAEWTPDCVSEETLLDFVKQCGKHLDAENLIHHISSCTYCLQGYFAIQEAHSLLTEQNVPQPAWREFLRWLLSPPALRLASAFVLIGVGLGGFLLWQVRKEEAKTQAVLVALQQENQNSQKKIERLSVERDKAQQDLRAAQNSSGPTQQVRTLQAQRDAAQKVAQQAQSDAQQQKEVFTHIAAQFAEYINKTKDKLAESYGEQASGKTDVLDWRLDWPRVVLLSSHQVTFSWTPKGEAVPCTLVIRCENAKKPDRFPVKGGTRVTITLPAHGAPDQPVYYHWCIETKLAGQPKLAVSEWANFAIYDMQRDAEARLKKR